MTANVQWAKAYLGGVRARLQRMRYLNQKIGNLRDEKGKEKAREYTSDLTEQPKYTEKEKEKEMRSLA